MKIKNYHIVVFPLMILNILGFLTSDSVNTILISQERVIVKEDTLKSIISDTLNFRPTDTLRKIENRAFRGGEYLRFNINYGFITAGEAILRVSDTIYNGRICYKVNFSLDSKPFFDVFYKVRDRYNTIIDAEGIFPWRFEQHIREGGFSRDFMAEFDHINLTAATTEGSYRIPSYVQDIMSAFYYTRTLDFSSAKPGETITLNNFYKDSTYELTVKYKGKQTIELKSGKFNCIVVEPIAKEGGLFKSEGKIYIWLTDDNHKMPVFVRAKIVIGSIESELVEYRGIAGPINMKVGG